MGYNRNNMAKTETFKPGQKYPVPKPNDSLAKFYTSTYRQKKGNSPMAEKWCLEHGLFKMNKAKQLDLQNKMNKLAIKK